MGASFGLWQEMSQLRQHDFDDHRPSSVYLSGDTCRRQAHSMRSHGPNTIRAELMRTLEHTINSFHRRIVAKPMSLVINDRAFRRTSLGTCRATPADH
jgi:hypothetical protein